MASISTDYKLALKQWHRIEAIRVGLKGTLLVDNVNRFDGVAPGEWKNLDLEGEKFYIGLFGGPLSDRTQV